MKGLMRLLMRKPLPPFLWFAGGLAGLLLLFFSIQGLGFAGTPDFDDIQNSRFAEALDGQPPLPAIRAAAADVEPDFAAKMRQALINHANMLRQSADAPGDFEGSRPTEGPRQAWSDTYVCGLEGWSEHRPVVRKLVAEGYGECGWFARFKARAPYIFGYGGPGGWLLTLGLPLLLILFVLGVIALIFTRRAYFWLYESHVAG